MAEVDFSLMMTIIQRTYNDISDLKQDMREVKLRMTLAEGHHASVMASLHVLQEQIDRLASDMRVVKRRLELVDAD